MTFLGLTLAPIRIVAAIIIMTTAIVAAMVGLIGVRKADIRSKPLQGWRRLLQGLVMFLIRGLYFCFGVHRVHVTGRKVHQLRIRIFLIPL